VEWYDGMLENKGLPFKESVQCLQPHNLATGGLVYFKL